MGTGLDVRGEGICNGVVLSLQNNEIIDDFIHTSSSAPGGVAIDRNLRQDAHQLEERNSPCNLR